MSGKSFKGNLEVLNLSDIFQSLAMNRHSGTLVVNDGKREKKIFFAEGEISLLSSGRRMRLGDLLIAGGKITADDLDLALKLQKQSRKKLGEILVEEGFCEQDDIDRLLRQQIEEELYDLFLWRKAEFEFMADQMPDDMIRESPQLTRLSINTNSLIMEALRRLDEWSLIQDAVPTTKEVFIVTDVDALLDSEVSQSLKADYSAIDGKTTVEGLSERLLLSEFELCQNLAILVKNGAIRALTLEELVERAETSYALNDFQGAAALYGRLAEYHPDEAKIMIPLADSLRRTGVERQALNIYEALAQQLERGGQDPDRLRQCYEAILQLDPSRHDLVRRIEDLDLRMASGPARRSLIPAVLIALLIAGSGAGYAFRDQIKAALQPEVSKPNAAAVDLLDTTLRLKDSADRLLERGKDEECAQRLREWHGLAVQLWTDHPTSPEFARVALPVQVTTTPPGLEVHVNGRYQSTTSLEKPTVICTYPPASDLTVEVRDPNGKSPRFSAVLDPKQFHALVVSVYDDPPVSFIADAWLDAGVARSEALEAFIAPERTGLLRVFRLDGNNLPLVKGWDNSVRVGGYGHRFSAPVIAGDALYLGVTRYKGSGGVVQLPLRKDELPGEPRPLYRSPGQVLARPVVRLAGGSLPEGRVAFATLRGCAFGFSLAGGDPVWKTALETPVEHDPLELPEASDAAPAGSVVFAGAAGRVTALSLADGRVLWRVSLPVEVAGPPLRFGDRVVLPLLDGQVVALDPATGAHEVLYTEPEGRPLALAVDGEMLFVATPIGQVRALAGGRELKWERTFRCGEAPARLAVREDGQLIVVLDSPEFWVLDPARGAITWQGRYLKGTHSGRAVAPIGAFGELILVSTDKQKLHFFRAPLRGE